MSKSADTTTQLFLEAKSAMAMCYAPYSQFPVGAAILAENGEIYKGANIENVSLLASQRLFASNAGLQILLCVDHSQKG